MQFLKANYLYFIGLFVFIFVIGWLFGKADSASLTALQDDGKDAVFLTPAVEGLKQCSICPINQGVQCDEGKLLLPDPTINVEENCFCPPQPICMD